MDKEEGAKDTKLSRGIRFLEYLQNSELQICVVN